jgi:DNA-damage-inducible protein J
MQAKGRDNLKTSNYNIRLDPGVKAEAEKTFAVYGLNLSEAITVFLHKSILERGFPFDIREPRPSAMLLQAIGEADRLLKEYADGTRTPPPYASAAEMFAAMDLEDKADGEYE